MGEYADGCQIGAQSKDDDRQRDQAEQYALGELVELILIMAGARGVRHQARVLGR